MKKISNKLLVISSIGELRRVVSEWRSSGDRVSLIPTMGALHAGHLALIEEGLLKAERTVVSIYVNPKQFSVGEDFESYPRTEEDDLLKLREIGVDVAYMPSTKEMYAPDALTKVNVEILSEGLCALSRPQLFTGVSTVVTKLLMQCLPDYAIFGEKDYQQLQIIKRLVLDLDIPVQVISFPTVREKTGLALSSRNAYLDSSETLIAQELYKIMQEISRDLVSGAQVSRVIESGFDKLISIGFSSVDYLTLCDSNNLVSLTVLDRPARLLVAANLGHTRLIDNIEVLPENSISNL